MDLTAIVLIVCFFVLLFINVPISLCIALSTLAALLMHIDFTPATTTIAQQMAGGLIALHYSPFHFLFYQV